MPFSPYALQKYIGERYCRLFSELYGLETVSLRYFNIFGPKQDPTSVYSAVIPRFIISLLRSRSPTVFGDGEQPRDFTYIDNVIHANLLAMSVDHLHGEVVNVACGEKTSLNQLLEALKRIIGSEIPALYQPPREGDVRHSFADVGKAREALGYVPRVDRSEGLRRTVEYFRSHRV